MVLILKVFKSKVYFAPDIATELKKNKGVFYVSFICVNPKKTFKEK